MRHVTIEQGPDVNRGKRGLLARAGLASLIAGLTLLAPAARADEGGVSFWIPGFFGSLAASPLVPGWMQTEIYYHTSVSAGANVALAREFQLGRVPLNLQASLNANVNAQADLGFVFPFYTFATPLLGGQV